MNWTLLIIGILVLLLSLTDILGQGRLLVQIVGKKNAKIINLITAIVFIALSFFA